MTNETAVTFYDLIDSWVNHGIEDFTEGIYQGNSDRDYLEAQRLQHDYLINQLNLNSGDRILDVGCGNGTLLARARERILLGKGITISPIQVQRCLRKGLDVSLKDYRDATQNNMGRFQGIVANGSLEHFVHPLDEVHGKQNEIYREMFKTFKDLLDSEGKLVTTAIHFNRVPQAKDVLTNPLLHKWGSDEMHYSFVLGNLGCYYPLKGQLEKCAEGLFSLEREVDGTDDYRITSEYWLNALWPSCLTSAPFWKSLLVKTTQHPVHSTSSLFQYLVTQSWNWQFRPDENGETPTHLLRQTWKCVD